MGQLDKNQLPPELVEKMSNEMYSEVIDLRQQRDELLEALQESQLQLEYLSKKFGETGSGNSIISRNNVTIKKHEDGKE